MGGPSTSNNGGNTLATVGTSHAGMTVGPTDFCKLANDVPAPFPNTAPTDRNPRHPTSQRTVVATKQIITVATFFGDPSDDKHAGVKKGVKSGTYRGFAKIQTGSQDLRTEGKPPGRHLDDTFQNFYNTTGMLRDTKQALDAANKNAAKLKRCTIVKLEVIEDSPARAAVGGYLEIVEGSTVTCTATRKNMAAAKVGEPPEKAPPPDCMIPPDGWKMTKFRVVRTGGLLRMTASTTLDKPTPRDETKEGVDVFKLDAKWVGDPPKKAAKNMSTGQAGETSGGADMSSSKGTDGISEAHRRGAAAANTAGANMGAGPQGNAGSVLGLSAYEQQVRAEQAAFAQARRTAKLDAYRKTKERIKSKQDKFDKDSKRDKKIISSLQAFRDVYTSFVPPQIVVGASACTGAMVTLVKVYPEGGFEFDLLELLTTWCKKFEDALEGPKKLLHTLVPNAGKKWSVGILNKTLFGDKSGTAELPTLKFKWEFKELEKDAPDGGPKKHCVGMSCGFLIGVEKLIFVRADFSVSLFVVVGGAIGTVVKNILDYANIVLELGVSLELTVGVTALMMRDEYHVVQPPEVESTLTMMASLYILARAGDFGSAKSTVSLTFTMKWTNTRLSKAPKPTHQVYIAGRKVTLAFQTVITANCIGLRDGKKFPDEPVDLITPRVWDDGWATLPV